MASFRDHDPDVLAVVARAIPGIVAIFAEAVASGHDVDLQVALDGRHYLVFVTVFDGDLLVKDVTVALDGSALAEQAKLVLLRLFAADLLRAQARTERRWAARSAAIRGR